MAIKICVMGALGKMGAEVIKAVVANDELDLCCAVDKFGVGLTAHGNIKIESSIKTAIETHKPDVIIDFTQPDAIFDHVKLYIEMGTKSVIGTTGLSDEQIKEIEQLSKEKNVGCFIAPNFTIGAVLMMMFARTAAKYFDNGEIIEFHHNQKKDAPSGTAMKTATSMAEEKEDFTLNGVDETETLKGARGAVAKSNIHIHSVRMPGFMASQEVIFGSNGQVLRITHDSTDRKCYMGGIMLAVKHVYNENKFVYGLENIL